MSLRDRPKWLIFGATSAVGRALRARLDAAGDDCTCVTRGRAPPEGRARWITGTLPSVDVDAACDVIASLGPLDRFADWLERTSLAGVRRVVALSSTSVETKREAHDAGERALAATLADAEHRVAARCEAAGVAWTILRPTLVHGGGDANLARIAALGRRLGFVVLPRGATGLRMPVHADDVAAAVVAAVASDAAAGRTYALPGGETLSYRAMVERTLAASGRRARVVVLPDPIARPALALAGKLLGAPAGLVDRMAEDLVFDRGPAERDFGYAPGPFRPAPGDDASAASRSAREGS